MPLLARSSSIMGNFMKRFYLLLLSISAFFLTACASRLPENLQTTPDTNLVAYSDVLAAESPLANGKARWGGVIAEITNLDNKTMLEVVYFDLRSYGRPIIKDDSAGRFRVYVDEFLDPLVYTKGRSVTVLGEFAGAENGKIGEHTYNFPVIKHAAVHVWKDIKTIRVEYVDPWPFARFGPAWRPWGGFYGPVYRRTIEVEQDN